MQSKRSGLVARIDRGSDGRPGPKVRAIITGALPAPTDVTHALIAGVAHCLWQARGGDDQTNWADAEAAVEQLLSAERAEARAITERPGEPARQPDGAPQVSIPSRRPTTTAKR